ncbi:M14 family zinc carboxypeptidase [Vibrio sp.]|nr:M14 family zinc carboxypeptidase [Vibrio sp.]
MKRQYISYQEMMDFLTETMEAHPNLVRLENIGETHEGRPIMAVKLSQDVEYADMKPAMLFTGTIHAREWIGIELAVNFIRYAVENFETDPKVRQALTRNTLYMVPCLNPDGFEYSREHFSFWRKNRRDNGDGTFGVDLNRNFGINFRKGGSPGSNVYGGPSAFSEPETQAMKRFVEKHNNITVALDYHSQGNVFFPAHKFNHEAEVEGTDLNVMCANMAHEIYKVTKRQYGIHRGKPPANLIHGSGREWYYDRGIMATVVEVGSRNIPDYLVNMQQSVDENIPAVLYALSSAINYSKIAPKRPKNFNLAEVSAHQVHLQWEAEEQGEGHYFEVYRSEKPKNPCNQENLVATTTRTEFIDKQLQSGTRYYYTLRQVDKLQNIRSPFAPELKVKTALDTDEYSYTLFPQAKKIGYVGEKYQDKNDDHFGYNSLFIGVNQTKGVCYGVIDFDMFRIPKDAIVKKASFSLYPMNRVGAKVENFGEWSVSLIDPSEVSDLSNFEQIANAEPVQTLGDAIDSDQITQGIWKEWSFSDVEKKILQKQLEGGRLLMRIQGPEELPVNSDSQMMQFDIGYGKFGGGIHYRPHLELIYTRQPHQVSVAAAEVTTIRKHECQSQQLTGGFDTHGNAIYGSMGFDLNCLNQPNDIVITQAYLSVESKSVNVSGKPVRFTAEVVEQGSESVFCGKQNEFLGFEVSSTDMRQGNNQVFMFDHTARQSLETLCERGSTLSILLRPNSEGVQKNSRVDWCTHEDNSPPKLVIEYIDRRKSPLATPANLEATLENGNVKLTWDKEEHEDAVGCYVVRNSFHPPRNPFDGVKIYAGPDGYTFDKFGNPNVPKYYSVFSYDNVPNYSQPASIMFTSKEVVNIEWGDFEAQDEVEMRYRNGD